MKTLPIRHTLTFAYRGSFAIAVLIAVVSAAVLLFGSAGLSGPAPKPALGATEAALLVPGFLVLDAYNFASLAIFVRGAIQPQRPVAPPIAGAHGEPQRKGGAT